MNSNNSTDYHYNIIRRLAANSTSHFQHPVTELRGLFPLSSPVGFFHLLIEVVVAVLPPRIVLRLAHQFWVGSKVAVLVQKNV